MINAYIRQSLPKICVSAFWILLFLICALLMRNLLMTAYIEFDLETSHSDQFAIYWANEGQIYSESRVARAHLTPHRKQYILPLGDLKKMSTLRIDPTVSRSSVRISRVRIYQFGYDTYHLSPEQAAQQFTLRNQVLRVNPTPSGLEIFSSGTDPQLEWNISKLQKSKPQTPYQSIIIRSILLFTLFVFVFKWTREFDQEYNVIPYAMLVAFILMFSMASVSRINAHPDEYVHVLAARHYISNHSPPSACEPGTEQSYSPYGFSRLNSTEIAYFLTGKYAAAVAFLPTKDIFKLRFFNISLFALLLILSIRSHSFRLLCIPLLAMPQTWYLFSYVNSDALALFTGLILTQQIIDPQSILRTLIDSGSQVKQLSGSLFLGLVLTCCALIKKNYYALDLFLVGWIALQYALSSRSIRADVLKIIPAVIIAGVLFSCWIFVHEQANDFERKQRIVECQQSKVHYRFRKDTPLKEQYHSLYWKDKGYPFSDLFKNHWGTKIFQSAFGHFGYLDIKGPRYYYSFLSIVSILLLLYVIVEILRQGTVNQKLTMFMVVGMGILLLCITAWKSWTKDFQPQGRYLFPMIPIIGLLLVHCRQILKPRVITSLILLMFIAGIFFFVQVGLVEIRRG